MDITTHNIIIKKGQETGGSPGLTSVLASVW
jgi:hypothetical protein